MFVGMLISFVKLPPKSSIVELFTEGIASNSKLDAPLRKVRQAMNIRKLPNLSAKIPAKGGPMMSAPGITLLTMLASSIVNPRAFK